MKKWLLGAAALLTAALPSVAQAQTKVADSGIYSISVLNDGQTCVMSAENASQLIMIGYEASGDSLNILVANTALKFAADGGYYVDISFDNQKLRVEGKGVVSGTLSGVILSASDSAAVATALINAKTLSFYTSAGKEIITVQSDSDFDTAVKMTVVCAFELQKTPAKSKQNKKSK